MYTDINYTYKQISGKLVLNDDTDVINQALTTLFNTPKGSRLFDRNYGSELENVVFELMSPALQDVIAMMVFREITQFEPRVVLKSKNDVNVSFDYDNNILFIDVKYNIAGNDSQSGSFLGAINTNR